MKQKELQGKWMHFRPFTTAPALALLIGLLLLPANASCIDLQVSAIILDKGNCSFVTPGPYAITFVPALDPLTATNRTSDVMFQVNCVGIGNKPSTVIIERQGTAQLYLKHQTSPADTIAYNLNLPATKAVTNNTPVPITVTATIAGDAYQYAPSGTYTDTVVLNVLP